METNSTYHKKMKKQTSERVNDYIRKNVEKTDQQLADEISRSINVISPNAIGCRRRRLGLPKAVEVGVTAEQAIQHDRDIRRVKVKSREYKDKYEALLDRYEDTLAELDAIKVKSGDVFSIPKTVSRKDDDVVPIAGWSDWHIEEKVKKEWVNGLNEYNLDIAKARSMECAQNTVKLLKMTQHSVIVEKMVIWLGGDFITSNIHDENVETALLQPIEAMIFAETLLKSCIQYVLDNTDVDLVIPCNAGNHSRITKKQRHSTEIGNSLETIMYHHLAEYFKDNPRVTFVLQQGYHLILPIFPHYKVRFHHGHALRYGGGVGGLYIPARKAIAQWQKSQQVQLDFFGHFHGLKMDGDLFVCNGSMIGHSPYATAIKADYEPPRQLFVLIDRKRGKTGVFPITFSK